MNSKERLLSTLRGQEIDRVAWAPFLAYWWEVNKNSKAESLGKIGFKRAIGADILMRGHYNKQNSKDIIELYMFKNSLKTSSIEEKINNNQKDVIYETPVGSLKASYTFSPAGDTWFLKEHPVKTEQDFKTLEYLVKDYNFTLDNNEFINVSTLYADALFIPVITPFNKSAFQSMIEHWVGTEEMVYALMDYPKAVHSTLEAMQEASIKAAKISSDSEAEAFISWEDTSTTNISPSWYESYILPELNEWCDILHEKNKLYIQHACGHLKNLVPLIAKSRIDAIESVASPPTGDINCWDMKDKLPDRIAIIGGIEPTFFMNADDKAIIEHIEFLLDEFKNSRFILANADSCPPSVDINRFGFVSKVMSSLMGEEEFNVKEF